MEGQLSRGDEPTGDDIADERRRAAAVDPVVGRRTPDALFGAAKTNDLVAGGAPPADVAEEVSGEDPGDARRRATGADPAASNETAG